ncbi:MAG: helix-turn-helix transcriptional regulator [Rhodobacteraceae bacterium]|nr:helix-turn-helix transcriptional regulator [Paracoccaceae bacterium]
MSGGCGKRPPELEQALGGKGLELHAFEADLHRTYVSGVEREVRNPSVLIVAKLAAALGVDPCKLLEFKG